jgi:hypothetical protein
LSHIYEHLPRFLNKFVDSAIKEKSHLNRMSAIKFSPQLPVDNYFGGGGGGGGIIFAK